jgi:ribosomal protein L30/L7E
MLKRIVNYVSKEDEDDVNPTFKGLINKVKDF